MKRTDVPQAVWNLAKSVQKDRCARCRKWVDLQLFSKGLAKCDACYLAGGVSKRGRRDKNGERQLTGK